MNEEQKTGVATDIAETATKLDEVLSANAEATTPAPDVITEGDVSNENVITATELQQKQEILDEVIAEILENSFGVPPTTEEEKAEVAAIEKAITEDDSLVETPKAPTEYWSNDHQRMLPINPVREEFVPPANSHWDVNAQRWVPNE